MLDYMAAILIPNLKRKKEAAKYKDQILPTQFTTSSNPRADMSINVNKTSSSTMMEEQREH